MPERSRKLQRQFSKILKADDAEQKLTALSAELQQRDASGFSAQVDMLARFPEFFSSVEKSYEEYEAQAKLAQLNLERSSAELNAANIQLENLNATIATMLDSLGQGIFSFGADGICASIFSKACLTLIEGSPAGRPIAEVLTSDPARREIITSLLPVLFSGAGSIACLDDIFDLFPSEFSHSKGMSLTVHYRPIYNVTGALHSVLVVVTDRTEEMAALRLGKEREKRALMVLRVSANRNVFTHFYHAVTTYFTSIDNNLACPISLEQVRRDVHTFKGTASLFYLQNLVTTLHDLETALAQVTTMDRANQLLKPVAIEVKNQLCAIEKEVEPVLGKDFYRQGSMRALSLESLKQFALELGRIGDTQELTKRFIETFLGEPIHTPLMVFAMGLQDLADRYGKAIQPCVLAGDNFTILTENYEALFDTFTHLARNIVSHAVERPDIRADHGKPTALTLTVTTEKFTREGKDWIRLSFMDDGGGIDVASLRQKLKASKGDAVVSAASDAEIMQAIFEDNLSTKDKIDELSGRGVGMSAIREAAQRLGGTVYVESERHRFTCTVIEVPLIWI